MARCIAGFMGFRRFRKKHPLKHDLVSGFFLSLFMLFISVLALTVSLSMGIPASVHDLISGPKTAHAALVDVSYYTPTGQYRAFTQSHVTLLNPSATLVLSFVTYFSSATTIGTLTWGKQPVGARDFAIKHAQVGGTQQMCAVIWPQSTTLITCTNQKGTP